MTRLLFFIAGFCLCSVISFAQTETMVTGKIRDSAGKNISGCEVRVCDCNKLDSSGLDGIYHLYLAPGNYELQVFRSGLFIRRSFVEIPPEDFFEVDFRL